MNAVWGLKTKMLYWEINRIMRFFVEWRMFESRRVLTRSMVKKTMMASLTGIVLSLLRRLFSFVFIVFLFFFF